MGPSALNCALPFQQPHPGDRYGPCNLEMCSGAQPSEKEKKKRNLENENEISTDHDRWQQQGRRLSRIFVRGIQATSSPGANIQQVKKSWQRTSQPWAQPAKPSKWQFAEHADGLSVLTAGLTLLWIETQVTEGKARYRRQSVLIYTIYCNEVRDESVYLEERLLKRFEQHVQKKI